MCFTTSRSCFPQPPISELHSLMGLPTFLQQVSTILSHKLPNHTEQELLNKLFLKRLGEAYPWKAALHAKDSVYKCTSLSTSFTPRRSISPPGRFLPCFLSTPINLESPPTEKKATNDSYSKASSAHQLIQPGRSAFIKDKWMCGLFLEKTSWASCWQWWCILTLECFYLQCPAFSCTKIKGKLSEISGVGRNRVLKGTDSQYLPQAVQTNFPEEVFISRALGDPCSKQCWQSVSTSSIH